MSKPTKTVKTLSYGLSTPAQLLNKLEMDAKKLGLTPDPHDVFNFVVTAAVLAEWIQHFYETTKAPKGFKAPPKNQEEWIIPDECEGWIEDVSYMPNPSSGISRHLNNMLSICAHTANASKHFHWTDKGHIESIGSEPPIADWYQYYFTSRDPDLYVTYRGENYGLREIGSTLIQFYRGLIKFYEERMQ